MQNFLNFPGCDKEPPARHSPKSLPSRGGQILRRILSVQELVPKMNSFVFEKVFPDDVSDALENDVSLLAYFRGEEAFEQRRIPSLALLRQLIFHLAVGQQTIHELRFLLLRILFLSFPSFLLGKRRPVRGRAIVYVIIVFAVVFNNVFHSGTSVGVSLANVVNNFVVVVVAARIGGGEAAEDVDDVGVDGRRRRW